MPRPGLFNRATFALAFALYAWLMLGVEYYLINHPIEGSAAAMIRFRRDIMGRACVSLGAAALLTAVILAVLSLSAKQRPTAAVITLTLCAGWFACLYGLWPI